MLTFYDMTKEEVEACRDLVLNMREEASKKKAHEEALERFHDSVRTLVDAVGLVEAKQIVREINRELREL